MADAEIIRLDIVRAQRALEKFRGRHDRTAVDTLYGPAKLGLSEAEIQALRTTELAEVRRQRGSAHWKVTLTALGRRERDKKQSRRAE
jgi:hypothetical protein